MPGPAESRKLCTPTSLVRRSGFAVTPARPPADAAAEYMIDVMGVPAETAPVLCSTTYHQYGTTLAGLIALGYQVDLADWHRAVHGSVGVQSILQRDEALLSMLLSLPQRDRLYVFTNADDRHAELALRALGIDDLFQRVFAFETLQELQAASQSTEILCKPAKSAFQAVLDQIPGASAHRTLFLDDSPRNCHGAASAGLSAVLVGQPHACPGALVAVQDVRNLRSVLPALWDLAAAPAEADGVVDEEVDEKEATAIAVEA